MGEFIVATRNVRELKEQLALNILSKTVAELETASSAGMLTIWFFPEQVATEGIDKGEVFFGLASTETNDIRLFGHWHPAFIESEDSILVLSCDFGFGTMLTDDSEGNS